MAIQLATYTFVVARSSDFAIGQGNQLPWKLPSDLKNFKAITMGNPIVMGRRTFDSIGRPLPGRPNIVISREGGQDRSGVSFVTSKEDAMALAQHEARRLNATEVMIVGGGEIFRLFDRDATKVHLTEVQTTIPLGDAHYYRQFSDDEWFTRTRSVHRYAGDEFSYVVTTHERRAVDANIVRHCERNGTYAFV
jgi:dihydrofolate reductase